MGKHFSLYQASLLTVTLLGQEIECIDVDAEWIRLYFFVSLDKEIIKKIPPHDEKFKVLFLSFGE